MQNAALITGGTSGIGQAIVGQFLAAGYAVMTCGRNAQKIEVLQRTFPTDALTIIQGDIAESETRAALVDALRPFKKLDCLVNNAGVIETSGGVEEDLAGWEKTLNVNLVAAHALTQECYPFLKQSDAPNIVNVSSVCGLKAHAKCSSLIYSVSKAGMDMMTLKLAQELGPEGIRVNSVNPGVVHTPMWGGEDELMTSVAAGQHVLKGQVVQPEDVANVVSFLASSKASKLTGALIPIDAGYNLK